MTPEDPSLSISAQTGVDPDPDAEGAGIEQRARREALARIRTEIDEEVATKRASASIAALEGQLEKAFAKFSPGEGSEHLMRRTLEIVDKRAVVDLQVPVASQRPGGSFFKRLVRAAVGWYVRFFVAQLTGFAHAVARALHVVAEDLEHLHEETSTTKPPLPDSALVHQGSAQRWWISEVASAFSEVSAPVMCADSADLGTLVALREAGIDAYGVRARGAQPDAQGAPGLDVRTEDLMDHARMLMPGSIGGAVLEGSVQWLGPRRIEDLLALLESQLDDGAVLAVVSLTPQAWTRVCDPLVVDLSHGQPLHPETWTYLMERHGFVAPRVHRGGSDLRSRLRSASTGLTPVDEELTSALETLLGGPDEYAVIAVRGAGRQ